MRLLANLPRSKHHRVRSKLPSSRSRAITLHHSYGSAAITDYVAEPNRMSIESHKINVWTYQYAGLRVSPAGSATDPGNPAGGIEGACLLYTSPSPRDG